MLEYAVQPNSLSHYDALACAVALAAILWFSVLAARAEARIWHTLSRFNGERRNLQRRITLGKSHLR